ncbi:hypothetical protein HanRHA438_Chr14g0658421 [Helianthus annuus]|nr:hypothetical protein HanRHA438_Chr14g0658421 [Helianthus annuus]
MLSYVWVSVRGGVDEWKRRTKGRHWSLRVAQLCVGFQLMGVWLVKLGAKKSSGGGVRVAHTSNLSGGSEEQRASWSLIGNSLSIPMG